MCNAEKVLRVCVLSFPKLVQTLGESLWSNYLQHGVPMSSLKSSASKVKMSQSDGRKTKNDTAWQSAGEGELGRLPLWPQTASRRSEPHLPLLPHANSLLSTCENKWAYPTAWDKLDLNLVILPWLTESKIFSWSKRSFGHFGWTESRQRGWEWRKTRQEHPASLFFSKKDT